MGKNYAVSEAILRQAQYPNKIKKKEINKCITKKTKKNVRNHGWNRGI
jgi:hypothetical protein